MPERADESRNVSSDDDEEVEEHRRRKSEEASETDGRAGEREEAQVRVGLEQPEKERAVRSDDDKDVEYHRRRGYARNRDVRGTSPCEERSRWARVEWKSMSIS